MSESNPGTTGIDTTVHGVHVVIDGAAVADLRRTTYRGIRAILAANMDYIVAGTVPERLLAAGKPPLVIFGDSAPRWDPASARQYEAVPGAELEYLRGVGHMAMLEAPDALARSILDYTR